MKKFAIFLVIFVSSLFTSHLYAQSCPTQFSGTTFQPKTGVTSANYNMDQIRLGDPSSEVLTTGFAFKNVNTPDLNEYTISGNKASFRPKSGGNVGIFTYNLIDLIPNKVYKIKINVTVRKIVGCSGDNTHRVNLMLKSGNNTLASINKENENFPNEFSQPLEINFTPTTTKQSFSLVADHSSSCTYIDITSIEVIGCSSEKIVSENGEKVCAGNENQLIAKGVTATSYTWQQSEDAGLTWTTIPQTTKVISVLPTTETRYKVTAGATTLPAITVRPVVCCAVAGERAILAAERFTFSGTNLGARTDKTPTMISGNATTGTYLYASTGNIIEGRYAVVKSTSVDGCTYWQDRGLTGNSKSLSTAAGTDKGTSDGFLLVNANVDPEVFYEQTFTDLCPNTIYDFSAFVANATTENGQTRAPVNVGFRVFGCNGTDCTTQLIKVESGDLPSSTNWVEKGGSFNSQGFSSVKVQLFNNLDSKPYAIKEKDGTLKVIGNDIAIDDITFSTCSPEIQVFSNAEYTKKDQTFLAENTERVYVWAPYDLTEFFATPWYVIQESLDGTSDWTNIYSGPNDYVDVDITLDKYKDKKYNYRAFVAAYQKTAEERAANPKILKTGCGQISAVSDTLWLTMEKPCTATPPPSVTNYDECPLTGTGTLATLVTSDTTQLRWYTQDTGGTALTTTTFDWTTVGSTTLYVTNQLADQGTTTYCESTRTAVTINIKPSVAFTVDKTEINVCTNSTDAERTFTVINKFPATAAITWKAMSDESFLGTGNTYTVPATVGQGELIIDGTDPTGCDFRDTVRYQVKALPDFTLTAPTMVCVSAPSATLRADITTDENGSTYAWYKGTSTTPVGSGTLTNETIITHEDNSVGTTQGNVTYRLVINNGICETEKTVTIAVDTEVDIPIISSATKNAICAGDLVDLTAQITLNTGETLLWKKDGVEMTETGTTITGQDLTANTVYTVELQGGSCDGDGTITITVSTPITPELEISSDVICLGGTINIEDINTENAASYVWESRVGTGNWTTMSQTSKNLTGIAPEVTTTYRKTAINGECTRVSNEVTVRVEPPLNFDVSNDITICAGSTTTLTMSNYPEEAVTFWIEGDINADDFMNAFKDAFVGETTNLLEALMNMMFSSLDDIVSDGNGTENPVVEDDDLTNEDELPLIDESFFEEIFTSLGIIGMEPTIDVTPTTTTTYTAVVMGVCTATRQVTVTVDAPITASISAPTTICVGDNTQLVATGGTTYRWTPATGLNNPNISNPIASPSVTTVYSVEITRGTCSDVTETTVTVVPLPVITNIEETNVREVTAYVENGLPPYSYSINNRDFITHNVLHDVSIGGHILYVVDMNNCKTSRPFEVTPIPIFPAKFFTPNDDGVNDYWTIENLNVYPSYIVQIFDRFGKLIYEVRSGQFHADGEVNYHPFQWDGNYLGHPLPSTDYWYLITLEEVRKQYTGHFTLKR